MKFQYLASIATILWFPIITTHAFSVVLTISPTRGGSHSTVTSSTTTLFAGGFEWEDPAAAFDQGVENPFKNPELMKGDGDMMKIDPARLLGPRLSGSNLYFIGMMGSGKSAIGNAVARRMGTYNFLDTDEIIEKATNMSIPNIFETEGEEAFRQVEAQILDSVHAYVRCVVSTGGGIVCRMQNWSKLQTGIVVWLDVEPDIIMKRIQGTNRPLLQTENPLQTLKDLSEKRRERYEQADVRIEITEGMDEDAVADAVIRALHDFIDENPPAWKMAKAKAQSEGLDWVQ
jgi:shikimate kinase